MKIKSKLLGLFLLGIVAIALYRLIPNVRSVGDPAGPSERPAEVSAPLLEGLGNHSHPITTRSPLAQRYFNQGLVLAYGFNHDRLGEKS